MLDAKLEWEILSWQCVGMRDGFLNFGLIKHIYPSLAASERRTATAPHTPTNFPGARTAARCQQHFAEHNIILTTSATVFIFINRMLKDLYKQVSQFKVVRLCLNNACLWYEIACWLEDIVKITSNFVDTFRSNTAATNRHRLEHTQAVKILIIVH